jgi:glycosyltransferase 2 family protein
VSGRRGRLIGLALTLVFLVLAVRRVDLDGFADALRHFNYVWLVPSAACTLLGYGLRTLRWQTILSGAARLGTLFPILVMGFATNNLLPGRLGEFWRAYLLGNKRNVRKSFALASVFVERVFDGLVLIGLLWVVSLAVALPSWGREVELAAAALFLAASAVVAMLVWWPGPAAALLHLALRPAPARAGGWLDEAFGAFVEGLAVLRRPRVLLVAALLSLLVWLCEGASYLILSQGIGLGMPGATRPAAIGLTLVTINLGIMVPSAPGYVGAQEFFGTLALGVFGADAAAALAFVLVSHAVQYGLVTGLGLVFFAREHLSPGDIGRAGAAASQLPAAVGVEAEPSA